MKILTTFGIILNSFFLLAQSKPQANQAISHQPSAISYRILLIPFEQKMLMSEIGKAVNDKTGLSFDKIADEFRTEMDLALYKTFKQTYTTISLLQNPKKGDTTISYIYSATGYKYDLLAGKDSSGESHAEFDTALQNKHFIHNGELQVPMDYSQRFMNVSINNKNLLQWLNKQYNVNTFVFINELDIKDVSNPSDNLTDNNFRRQITAHYSILNTQYQYLTAGIVTANFPYNENNPKTIGEKYFSVIAQELLHKFEQHIIQKK